MDRSHAMRWRLSGAAPRGRAPVGRRAGRKLFAHTTTLVLVGLLTACGPGAGQRSAEHAFHDVAECRELGGGYVYIHHDSPGGSTRGVRLGLPTDEEGVSGDAVVASAEDRSDAEVAEARRLRERNGWDDEAVMAVLQEEASPQQLRRLAQMPSCLEELPGP